MTRNRYCPSRPETLTAAGISAFMREIRATTVKLEQNANPRLALEVLHVENALERMDDRP